MQDYYDFLEYPTMNFKYPNFFIFAEKLDD